MGFTSFGHAARSRNQVRRRGPTTQNPRVRGCYGVGHDPLLESTPVALLHNPWRGAGLPPDAGVAEGTVRTDSGEPLTLLERCPAAAATPLRAPEGLAAELGLAEVRLKDETGRMGLGSFKALGAAYVIAREAARRASADEALPRALEGCVYACASAGNHGLSLAAGARVFGATAVIHLADDVPEAFAERLRQLGAEVVRPGGDYEAAMRAVAAEAECRGWVLLSDSSWPGYVELPARVMEGYLVMGAEIAAALPEPPTHIVLQAGVGGLAAALCAYFRARWGEAPVIVVAEPEAAPALIESIRAGRPRVSRGPASNMGRLDCKAPSHLALAELARGADWFVTLADAQAAGAVEALRAYDIETTPSGAAGVAALRALDATGREQLGLSRRSRVLAFVTEGPEEAA
jgi:diaminopropionate ammonia-lyase